MTAKDANNWASPLHYRLYLQGHNGRARQRIIDTATNWCVAGLLVDAVDLGRFIESSNERQLDNLEIKMSPIPWYVELWQLVRYGFEGLVSWAR